MFAGTKFILALYLTVCTIVGASGWFSKSSVQRHRGENQILLNIRGGDANASASPDAPRVIIIDVDNCLYSEKELLSSVGKGIESQIVQNTHLFGMLHFNLTSNECDELYKKYGSTIEGLRHTLPSHLVNETMGKFYREVYDPIDFGCLLGIRADNIGVANDNKGIRSGYDHGHALQKRRALVELLDSVSNLYPVYLASNSPKAHIMRVIDSMGLNSVHFSGILAPDTARDDHASSYPTKSSPEQYYEQVLKHHSPDKKQIILLDDSMHNLRQARSVGIGGVQINGRGRTLEEGLAEALGHILPMENAPSKLKSEGQYTFSDVKYLRAKNEVDANAINTIVWAKLAQELTLRLQHKEDGKLRIADLGAGMLSMLQLFMNGGGEKLYIKPSMIDLIRSNLLTSGDSDLQTIELEYFAYESNNNLLDGCRENLKNLGFVAISDNKYQISRSNIKITVNLRTKDFQNEREPPESLDLIVGCCFADLFDPDELGLSLLRFAHNSKDHPPLVYLPITFAGQTRFESTLPFQEQNKCNRMIPSDTTAFQLYAKSLATHGHNLDPSRIVKAICNFGGSLIAKGASDWKIDPKSNQYLWGTMMYFVGMSGGAQIIKNGLDAAGWLKRSRNDARPIIASNVDLLFHLGRTQSKESFGRKSSSDLEIEEIQFVSPYNVTTVNKQWNRHYLRPDQIELESVCSLVSSGTELKIFKGSFESASLDVNIKGMADESMEYPLAYGYSLVGKVVACGSNVTDSESLIGRYVFTFSPHSSRVIVDRDAVQIIPDGIQAEDAIFMPSVETALSLVQDANVRFGENVCIMGQGIIGLLVAAILSLYSSRISSSEQFCSVTAFDALDDRLEMSSNMGATSALKPQSAIAAGPFDVSIEVSGNPRALQSAIDNTSNNGRIIVGSWYGNTDVSLKLGIDFHRSHKTIQTSQVSTIPSTMTGLWSKERRFSLTWALVRALQPSRLITKRTTLEHVQEAYELLDGGKEIAICFKYNNG